MNGIADIATHVASSSRPLSGMYVCACLYIRTYVCTYVCACTYVHTYYVCMGLSVVVIMMCSIYRPDVELSSTMKVCVHVYTCTYVHT